MNEKAFSNIDAEQSLLGAAMRDRKVLAMVADLNPEDFSEPAHRLILMAMKEMQADKSPVDLVTLDQKLSAANRIDKVGGTSYLVTIMQNVPSSANAKAYLKIVKDCSARRRLKLIGDALINAAGDLERSVDDVREKAALCIRDVRTNDTVDLINQETAVMDTYTEIGKSQKTDDSPPERDRILTGIQQLDTLTGGLYGSKMIVIGARPSVGKSIFALTICVNAAKQGKRVLLVSLEMEADEIVEREFAFTSLVPLSEITSDRVSEEAWVKLAESLGPMSKYPIYYCTEAFTVEKVRKAAFQLYENGGLDMICVDYLQLMSTPRSKGSRSEEVGEISRGLKRLAQELKIPVIALTQLNRASEKSYGKKQSKRAPTISEARESGAIEQDANIFILLHDPGIDELADEEKETFTALKRNGMSMIHVNVAKNRQGKKAIFYLAFDGEHQRFLKIAKEGENEG
mgnify:CR=1 FL=1